MNMNPLTYHILKADYDPSEWAVEPYTIVEAFTCMSDLQVRAEEIRLEVAVNQSLDGVELEVDVATKEELKELLDNYTYYNMFPEEHPDKIKQKEEKEKLQLLTDFERLKLMVSSIEMYIQSSLSHVRPKETDNTNYLDPLHSYREGAAEAYKGVLDSLYFLKQQHPHIFKDSKEGR